MNIYLRLSPRLVFLGQKITYKQFGLADEIRGWLESQGVTVEDSAAGSIWEYRPTS